MKKWYDEEYKFEIETIGFLRGDKTEYYCRNGEQIGDKTNVPTVAPSTRKVTEFAARL